jgi:hypothetical protein
VRTFSRVCMSLITKASFSFETSVSGNPMMQHHVPEELNHVQVYRLIIAIFSVRKVPIFAT